MNRLIILTTIIIVVYSWEDFKAVLLKIIKRDRYHYPNIAIDRAVANTVLLITAPASIIWLMAGSGSLADRLGIIFIYLLLIVVLTTAIRKIQNKNVPHAMNLAHAAGQFAGRHDFLTQFIGGSPVVSLYAKALIWPILIGLMLNTANENFSGGDPLEERISILIIVATAGLIMNLTISFLKSMFRYYRFGLFEYFRILLGIGLFFLLVWYK